MVIDPGRRRPDFLGTPEAVAEAGVVVGLAIEPGGFRPLGLGVVEADEGGVFSLPGSSGRGVICLIKQESRHYN